MNMSPSLLSGKDALTPLLRRAPLLPGESLASLLERLTHLNFYPNSRFWRAIGCGCLTSLAIEEELTQPTCLKTFQQLGRLTGLPLDELYAASDHRFAALLVPLGQTARQMPWLENTFRACLELRRTQEHLRSNITTQFCPLCLKAGPYQRLSWIPRAAAICLEHRCLLTDRCHRCWRRTSVAELVSRQCANCGADLRRARRVSIAHDTLGILSQQIIQAWFQVADLPAKVITACGLPFQPSSVLYHLLHLLARQLLNGKAEWRNLSYPLNGLANPIAASIDPPRYLTPEQAYFLYRSAFAGLLNWPEGLFRVLDVYGGYEETCPRAPTRPKCLRRAQRDWLATDWHGSPLAFVQQAFVDYLLARQISFLPTVAEHFSAIPWFVGRTGLWTEGHTARVLGISLHDLRRFSSYGSLAECLVPTSRARLPLFQRERVLAVQQRWAAGWSLDDVSCWLGLPPTDVLRLVELGLLTLIGDAHENEEANIVFDRHCVAAFFEHVLSQLKWYPGKRYSLSTLGEAASELAPFEIDRATLLQGMMIGLWSGYRYKPDLRLLAQVCFEAVEVSTFPDWFYAQRGWAAGHHFAQEHGFAPRCVRKWQKAGLIKPVAIFEETYGYFQQEELLRLAIRDGIMD